MERKITYRKGITVHLGEKPYILDLVSNNFGEKRFVKSEIRALVPTDISDKSLNKHLETFKAPNSGWLNSKKVGKGTNKDSRNYGLSKKALDYKKEWESFTNGPAFKKKKPIKEIEYRDREVKKEVEKKYKRTVLPVEEV